MIRYLITFTAFALLSGCTLPLYVTPAPHLTTKVEAQSVKSVVVLLEPIVDDKPLQETVVDNASGVYWSPGDAAQIGFTQNYGESLLKRGPQLAVLAAAPPGIATGLAASGQLGGSIISSRILIPIGLYITKNTEQLFESATSKALVCLDLACLAHARDSGVYDNYVIVHIQKIRVGEDRPNRITLEVEAQVKVHGSNGQSSVKIIQSAIRERDISSEGITHLGFLKVLIKMANEVSSELAAQVLAENGFL